MIKLKSNIVSGPEGQKIHISGPKKIHVSGPKKVLGPKNPMRLRRRAYYV